MDKTLASVDFAKRRELSSWPSGGRLVVAAVCYRRQAHGGIEFLLVRTRAGRWTFPKGGVDGDPTAAMAAAREAHEEAGVRGRVETLPFAQYLHYKNARTPHPVNAHLCRVLHLETPREIFRAPRWFSAESAKRRLREERPGIYAEELERVVDRAVRLLEPATARAALAHLN
jgi:8-oxo-dGTP pyrophosphatase MutT (NUDIX family)